MAENVDNIVLEQLRLIREDLGAIKGDLAAFKSDVHGEFAEVKSDMGALRMMVFGLASVMGQLDQRVEHVEEKLGLKP
jgi:hypothetical protein